MPQDSAKDVLTRLRAVGLPLRRVTRFAPSPTGHLHLGHVANAVWTWGLARALGAEIVLRIEDHDRGRCRPEYEASILEDLAWLGLHADRPALERQSDHSGRYAEALERLRASALVYACACSRKDLAARAPATNIGDEQPYDNHCRALSAPPQPDQGVRVALPGDTVAFDDLLLGPITQTPARQCGDLLLRERNGLWTYQCCVVVDDLADGVNLIVRGQDILPSTGRQRLLARLLGDEAAPTYLHHPLIHAPDGRKLSKREAAQGIRELRAAGHTPEAVLGTAAHATGLLPEATPVAATELSALFTR